MSEKRFICGLGFPINSDDPIRIISDSVEDKDYYKFSDICNVLNEQQDTINKLQSIINHIKCKENCEDYDYCCETVCSFYNEIKHLKEENEQLKIANARWVDKSLQDKQTRYSNENHKELTEKYLQLNEENEKLRGLLEEMK